MDKELTKLVERLERIFPHVQIHYQGEIFSSSDYEDFAPPRELDWFEVIERLKKDGLEISNRKDRNSERKCYCGNPVDLTNVDCDAFSLCKDHADDC